jgi:hypothetical protein
MDDSLGLGLEDSIVNGAGVDRGPLPGIAGHRRASLPATPQATGPRRLSPVPRTTIRPFNAQYAGGFSAPAPGSQASSVAFAVDEPARHPLVPPAGGCFDDACSGFARAADRTVAPPRFAPGLSTTHGGIATGDPGVSPDGLTPAGRPELVARLHDGLPSLVAPERSGRTRRLAAL